MQEISSAERAYRIPPKVSGIQVNYCKNPLCDHYGIPASQVSGHAQKDRYTLSGSRKNVPVLKCLSCNEHPPLKSNLAIAEELGRLGSYLAPLPEPSCPNDNCGNHHLGISNKAHYASFGKTRSGSQRYKCKACNKTFAVANATTGQKQPYKNRMVFSLLMNKMPFRRICEAADIGPQTLYAKIDFLHQQCLAFAAHRERKLREGFKYDRVYVSVDRQEYVVNWSQRKDKRNVRLLAVGSADNGTGYVFGMHLNYTPELDSEAINADASERDDTRLSSPFRQYARLWLNDDYEQSTQRQQTRRVSSNLSQDIEASYQDAVARDDVEAAEQATVQQRLPAKGMQIHAEYTLYGHFFLLAQLLGGVDKVRLFLDQDSGMRAAALAAFQPRVAKRSCDAFYVRIAKHLTTDEKKKALAVARDAYRQIKRANSDEDDNTIKLALIKQRLHNMVEHGHWKDRWLDHPFPNMSEPEKAVCYLTDYSDYDEDHLAWLYNKASLHGIDRFFMQVRRRLSLLERPIHSASAANRTWHGYSAYNPNSIVKLLDIFRVYYNYCLKGQDKQTPAVRLGLAKAPNTLEDIIYYA